MSRVYFWGAIGVKGVQSDEPCLLAGGKKSTISNLKPLSDCSEIVQVSAGGSYCLMLDSEGSVYAFGKGADHRLGLGDERDHFESPCRIPQLKSRMICAGYSHGMALLKDTTDKVVLWGKLSPQMNFTKAIEKVVPLVSGDEIAALRCGNGYAAVITKMGHVFMIGRNSFFKCGFEATADLESFKQLVINDNGVRYDTFRDIDLGYDSTLAITSSGEVYGFGSNGCYQLGIGKVSKSAGHLPTRLVFSSPINAVQVACSRGSSHNCHGIVLDADGTIHSFGSGYKYKLGTTTTDDQPNPVKVDFGDIKIKQVVPGGIHNLAITVDHAVVSFGCGSDGRLGHEESKNFRYLYKETEPRKIEALGNKVVQADSDYYFGIALVK